MKDRLSGKGIFLLYVVTALIIVLCFFKLVDKANQVKEVYDSRYEELEELLNE